VVGLRETGRFPGVEDVGSSEDAVRRLIKRTSDRRKQHLDRKLKQASFTGDLKRLASTYESLLPQWQKAKQTYKNNKREKTWREHVALDHPLLPKSLINRLSGNWGDIGEIDKGQILAKCDKGDIASPSAIAVEHAARVCGATNYEYHSSYLFSLLKKGRAQRLRC
jgi:hypothetical protein